MYLAALPNTKDSRIKKSAIEFTGLDRRSEIADTALASTRNMSTKAFPLLSPRASRDTHSAVTNGMALFASTKLAVVDGTDFYYDGELVGTVTATPKSMTEISQRIVIFPDKVSYDTISGEFSTFGAGDWYNPAGCDEGSVPDIVYTTTMNNRVWGVDGQDNICCTALGDYDDWTTFTDESTGGIRADNAWAATTGTNGAFTGIHEYKGYVMVFKEEHVWRLYGDTPKNFQFTEVSKLGCIDNKSIVEVNDILFWLSPLGVAAYAGGFPEIVSECLNTRYVSGTAGGDGRYYYISLFDGKGYELYCYDTWKSTWFREDSLHVQDFAFYDNHLYALEAPREVEAGTTDAPLCPIWQFNAGRERVHWGFETKRFTEQYDGAKGYSELRFRADLGEGAYFEVYVKYNDGEYRQIARYADSGLGSVQVPLRMRNCDHFQIRLEGHGEVTLHQFTRVFHYLGR